ncbi:U3 small nucleolar RNA-associated protein 6 [Plasmodiophora brassicae]
MADRVDRVLERDLQCLDDLQRLGVFSAGEIRAIVNRRRTIEYNLHRRQPIQLDFVRGIQFEVNLDALVSQRVARLAIKSPAATECQQKIRARALALHERTVNKFPQNLALWFAYLDYGRSIGGSKSLSKAFNRALQLHPTCPELWIKAMTWEFDDNDSIAGSRVLMQRALRMLPTSQDVWLAFFCMEVQYYRRVRNLLSEDQDGTAVPRLLFDRACQAIPDDVDFRLRFLDQCPSDCSALVNYVSVSIAEAFPQDPAAVSAIANRQQSTGPFEAALESAESASPALLIAYAEFLAKHRPLTAHTDILRLVDMAAEPDATLDAICIRAHLASGVFDDNVMKLGGRHPQSAEMWSLRCHIASRRLPIEDVLALHEESVRACPSSLHLWLQYMRSCVVADMPDRLVDVTRRCIGEVSLADEDKVRAKLLAIRTCPAMLEGPLLREVLVSPASPELFEACLERCCIPKDLLETGLSLYGTTSARLWALACQREPNPQAAVHLQWRARKALSDPSDFERAITA